MTSQCKLLNIVSHVEEDIGDSKGVIRIRKSNKDRQNNGKSKKTKNNIQTTAQKTKDRVTRTPL